MSAAEIAAARASGTHQCPAPACQVQVPDGLLMCKRHWSAVPHDIQRRIHLHHRSGQSVATMSADYLDAMNAAIDSLRTGPKRRFVGARYEGPAR